MKISQKLLAFILAAAMCITLVEPAAFALDETELPVEETSASEEMLPSGTDESESPAVAEETPVISAPMPAEPVEDLRAPEVDEPDAVPEPDLQETAEVIDLPTAADESTESGSHSFGDSLTWSLDTTTGVLTISGTGATPDYNHETNCAPWYDSRYSIRSVTVESGITSLGADLFYGLPSVTEISLPATLSLVGSGALARCSKLAAISVESGCESFTTQDGVLFSADMTCLVQYPLAKTGASYSVPAGVTKIGNYAFTAAPITQIELPDSLKVIGEYAFCDSKITSISLPSGMEEVQRFAFASSSLTRMEIFTLVPFASFAVQSMRSDLEVIQHVTTADLEKDYEKSPWISPTNTSGFNDLGSKITELIIDDIDTHPLTCIGSYALSWLRKLSSFTIPETVTSVGDYAFYTSLIPGLTLPKTIQTAGHQAFSIDDQNGTVELRVPSSVYRTITENAFANVENLTLVLSKEDAETDTNYWDNPWSKGGNNNPFRRIEFESDVTRIGNYVISAFNNMTSLTLPEGITELGDHAIYQCANLTELYLPSTLISLGENNFEELQSLQNFYVAAGNPQYSSRDGVIYSKDGTTLVNYPVYRTDTSFTIPAGVTTIGSKAFYNARQLLSIALPDGLTVIEKNAFKDCQRLESIILPDTIREIQDNAFYHDYKLTSINFPDGLEVIGASAFYPCAFTKVDLPASVTSVGSWAFGLTTLKEFSCYGTTVFENPPFGDYTPDSVQLTLTAAQLAQDHPDDSAPWRNIAPYVTALVIDDPENCSVIGSYSLSYFKKITDFTLPDGIQEIHEYAFPYYGSNLQFNTSMTFAAKALESYFNRSTLIVDAESAQTGIAAREAIGNYINIIRFADGTTTIGDKLFWGWNQLDTVIVPNGVTAMGTDLFCYSFVSAKNLYLPSTLESYPDTSICDYNITIHAPEGSYAETRAQELDVTFVAADLIPVSQITLNTAELTLLKGSSSALTATLLPVDASWPKVDHWSSDNESIATVDANGLVTAVAPGTTTIRAWSSNELSAACTVSVESHATAAAIDPSELVLPRGSTDTLTAILTPSDATDSVTWTSSNPAVATIDQNGVITAIKAGNTTIVATAGSVEGVCEIIVTVPCESLSLTAHRMATGTTQALVPIVIPADTTDALSWTSSDPVIAEVSSEGVVTAKAAGTVTITLRAHSGVTAQVSINVTDRIPAESLTLNQVELTLSKDAGDTAQLTAQIGPADTTDTFDSIVWTSSNDSVATVENGLVTAVGGGTAVVTASIDNVAATVTVNVTAKVLGIELPEQMTVRNDVPITLQPVVTPGDATETLSWSSSNPEVATVDENGTVTAITGGSVIISASAPSGAAGYCTVTTEIACTGIDLSSEPPSILFGTSYQLNPVLQPENTTDTIFWRSSDENILTVSEDGTVTAQGIGTATITAYTEYGTEAEITILSALPATAITLSQSEAVILRKDTLTLTASLTPEDSTDGFTWTSSDTAVATVSEDGTVTAVAAGTAVITATADSGVTASCNITVQSPKYKIAFNANGGTGTMAAKSCAYGTGYALPANTFTRTGYTFTGWNTAADRSGTAYANTQTVKNLTSTNGATITLYACWAKTRYTITYSLGGGTNNSSNPTGFYYNTATITLKNPTRPGCTFVGWYSDSACKNKITEIPKGTTSNQTVYAKWTAIKYTITYNLNSGTNSTSNPDNYTVLTSTITLAKPTRKGYTFKGWYTDSACSNPITAIEKGTTGNLELYAKWAKTTYKIAYVLNEGTNNTSNPTSYNISTATITPAAPSRLGYTFAGWYSDSALTKAVTSIPKGSTGNKTLYAKWTLTDFDIVYNLGGGTNSTSNPATFTMLSDPITLAKASRKGYSFKGWFSDAELTQPVTTIETGTTETVELFAKWAKVKYTLTYELNGGENNASNPGYYYVNTATITLAAPTRTGCTFKGWFSDPEFTKQVTTIAKGSTGSKTLYAKWEGTKYTITYELNGGTNSASNPASYTYISDTITLAKPTRKGYTFVAWYSDSAYTTKVTRITAGSTGDLTLYARWKAISYNIVFDTNGATWGSMDPIDNCSYGKSYTIPEADLIHPYLTFCGWSLNADGSGTIYKDGGSVKNLTIVNGKTVILYAVWKVVTPTVTADTAKYYAIEINAVGKKCDSFEIWHSTTKTGTYTKIGTASANWNDEGTYTHTGLATKSAHYYKVRAVKTYNETNYYSDFSAPVRGATGLKPSFTAKINTSTEYHNNMYFTLTNKGSKDIDIYCGYGRPAFIRLYQGSDTLKGFPISNLDTGTRGYHAWCAPGATNTFGVYLNSGDRYVGNDPFMNFIFFYDGGQYEVNIDRSGVVSWH